MGGTSYFVEQTLPWCQWPFCPINDVSFNLTLCLSCLPGSPAERSCLAAFSPQWQVTQSRRHCKFQGRSLFVILTPHPPTHTPPRLVQFEAASRHSVLAEKLKDLSRENLHTSSERDQNLARQLALAPSAWSGMRGGCTGFPGSRMGQEEHGVTHGCSLPFHMAIIVPSHKVTLEGK